MSALSPQTFIFVTVPHECTHSQSSGFAASGELLQLWSGALHPRNPSVAVTTGGQNLQLWDLRSMSMCGVERREGRV